MKNYILLSLYAFFTWFTATAQAQLLPHKQHNNIAYFIDNSSVTLHRYSLESDSFLTEVTLTANPKAIHVDDSGVYISYGTEVVKFQSDFSSVESFRVTSENVLWIDSTDGHVMLSGKYFLQMIDKTTGTLSSSENDYYFDIVNAKLSLNKDKIFIDNYNDYVYFELSADGIIGDYYQTPSSVEPYADDDATEFSTQNRIIDETGNIYNVSDLNYIGSIDSFDDIEFWQGLPIILRDNSIYSYNKLLSPSGNYDFSNDIWAQQIIVYGDNIYAFEFNTDDQPDDFTLSDDTVLPRVNKIAVSSTSPDDPNLAVDPSNSSFVPDEFALNDAGDTLYVLHGLSANIFRWSVSTGEYLESISLDNSPLDMLYSGEHNRIYLSYANGDITYIDLTSRTEYSFTSLDTQASALVASGNFITIRDDSGAWGTLKSFSADGKQWNEQTWIEPTSFLAWGAAFDRVYYISGWNPSDLKWIYLDQTSGIFGEKEESPYHSSVGWEAPIRVSENGSVVALKSGRIVNGTTMEEVTTLSDGDSINDLAWLYGNLFTLHTIDNGIYTHLKRWNADYSEDSSAFVEFSGSPLGLVPNPAQGKIHALINVNDSLVINSYEFTAIDSDNDGVDDYLDAFPDDVTEWSDFDGDSIGDNQDSDDDNDGVDDINDAFPRDSRESLDTDGDFIGNEADQDDDNDNVLDSDDSFPLNSEEYSDIDGDGIGDNSDPDIDGDNYLNSEDAFPLDNQEWFDIDGDGIGNNTDTDDGTFTPDSIAFNSLDGIIYMLDKASNAIHRWSIADNDYLTAISLDNTPSKMTFSAEHHRIYLSYSKDINYIDLADHQEHFFASIYQTVDSDSGVDAMISAGNFIVIRNDEGAWGSFIVFDQTGAVADAKDWIEPANDLAWNATYNRLYYISRYSPSDLQWLVLDPVTGKFSEEYQSPYHSSEGWVGPIKVSQNGKSVSLNSGRVVMGKSLTIIDEVTDNVTVQATSWLYGNLFTLSSRDANSVSELKRWNTDFTEDTANYVELSGAPLGLISAPDTGDLYLITDAYGLPTVSSYQYTATDDDNDGVLNHMDAFPNDVTEWDDFDEDEIGNNADEDDDNDNFPDISDAFPFDKTEWIDTDSDGIGNNADEDDDNDNVIDYEDIFPLDANESSDFDNDGQGDNGDIDDDNDFVIDTEDAFPFDGSEWDDTDGDGIGSNTDNDDDNDGVEDVSDFYPLDDSRSEIVASDFYPTNEGSFWRYRGYYSDVTSRVTLGDAINVGNKSITPFTFSDGAKLYLKVDDNKIRLYGFDLPDFLSDGNEIYSADIRLNTGINVLLNGRSSGSGSVDITPTYGEKSVSWSAQVNYFGSESVYISSGRYDALGTSVSFSGTAVVDGQSIALTYQMNFWFVEGIGIVIVENEYDSYELISHTITENSAADSGAAPASSSEESSGGSYGFIWLGFGVLLLLWRKH